MDWPTPLTRGTLVKRYKRFLADIQLEDGSVITAHCANPGAMTGMTDPGLTAYLSTNDNPKRKLKYSLEALEVAGQMVGINTALPNQIAEEAIRADQIRELVGYDSLRREVKYGKNSRIDILLEGEAKPKAYVEIKNVTLLRQPALAEFPDSVTARGTKHLLELADMVAEGHRAVMFYLVQRMDCLGFSIAADIDPTYAETLTKVMDLGVEAFAYDCAITTSGICVRVPVPIVL
jgi:sugar fermentation stimulation protein A